jgi:hypothetical protein
MPSQRSLRLGGFAGAGAEGVGAAVVFMGGAKFAGR